MEIPACAGPELQTGDGFAAEADHLCAVDAHLARQTPIAAIGPARRARRRRPAWPCRPRQADDLIQLNGDLPVTLSGGVSYGLLYLDGTVRLAGDTAITANDVFIGPDAQLQTCFDPGATATTARTAARSRSRPRAASRSRPRSTCAAAVGTNRAGGTLVIHAARVSLGGGVETAGTAAPSGGISIDSPGLVVTQNLHAPGAAISVHGAGGVSIGGDVSSAGTDTATGPTRRVTSGGGVDLASSGGDVSVLGSIASFGRDMARRGGLEGGHGGPVTVDRRRRAHLRRHRLVAPAAASTSPRGSPAASRVAARGSLVVSGAGQRLGRRLDERLRLRRRGHQP